MSLLVFTAFVALAALAVAGLALLLGRREPWHADEAPERFRVLQRAYEKTLRALMDIEFDRQAGILSEADHAELRAEYKRRAVDLRKALERGRAAAARAIAAGRSAALSAEERRAIEKRVAARRAQFAERGS